MPPPQGLGSYREEPPNPFQEDTLLMLFAIGMNEGCGRVNLILFYGRQEVGPRRLRGPCAAGCYCVGFYNVEPGQLVGCARAFCSRFVNKP